MHDIVCSHCGAHDMVPFRPRPGSDVLCRTCHQSQRDAKPSRGRASGGPRGRGGDSRGRRDDSRGRRDDNRRAFDAPEPLPTWPITCNECGADDSVPFEPRPGSNVLCRECHDSRKHKRDLRDRYGARRPKAQHIPRIEHGTRVAHPITCESCGKNETLGYVPTTKGPIYCTECASKKFGRSWFQVSFNSPAPPSEDGNRDKPRPRRSVYTNDRRNKGQRRRYVEEIAKPNPKRLENFESLNGDVKIKRS